MNTVRRLALLAAAALLAACATTAPPPAHFKILQLNDVYKIEGLEAGASGGLARVRTLRKHLESDGTPVLLLHAGDALFPSVMSKYLEAKPMIAVLNLLDGDAAARDPRLAITFGNHEFDKSDPTILLARMGESQFDWVSTNSVWCHPDCNAKFPAAETMLYDLGGLKVGVLGLLYPMQKPYVKTTDLADAAMRAVQSLRGRGARVVVAVTHEDMSDDVALAKSVPGIDLIVGGHDHLFLQERVGDTWITKADADAKSVIVYDVNVGARVQTTPLRVVLDTTIAKDPTVDAEVQRWLGVLSEKLGGNRTLGTTRNLLEGVEPAVRGRETALGNLLADVAREQMQTDVAFINGGSIRINDNIPPGPITSYDMEGIFYYTNTLVAFPLTGRQVLDMLNNSVSRADAGDGRFLQVSGIRFGYRANGGGYVVDASDVTVGGKPLDLDATYSVASVDYLYLHGTEDNYTLFGDATRPPKIHTEREADFRKSVEAYITKSGTVEQSVEGRIVRR
ncbi:MAG TPA: bifunctional UDP-sugar hydrolase/5'-nucleotidase [Thermoanaerobaculia bacterium]|jgi:2',3'-cyclic-nucleotide 2'-phosphodiesterase (5'-nucleotidase family)